MHTMHMMLKIAYHNQEKGLPDFKDTRIILPSPPSSPIYHYPIFTEYYYPIIYGIRNSTVELFKEINDINILRKHLGIVTENYVTLWNEK